MNKNTVYQTPHLAMPASTMQALEKQLLDKQAIIETWFQSQWKNSPAPLYGSVDLRNSGFKLAPVDMNLFPAGFNNLNQDFLPLSVEASRIAIHKACSSAKNIVLISESHTRNPFYWENIAVLLHILNEAGFHVKIGTLMPGFPPNKITLKNGEVLEVETIQRQGDRIQLSNFVPDLILLNNDLSEGIPPLLHSLSQPILPPAELGWSQRLKSAHFHFYESISQVFANEVNIDPWCISPLFRHCGEIDFMTREGEDCLAAKVDELLVAIQKKYDEYGISCKPFIVIKADAGTYGMAVMMVKNGDEVRGLNRKQRTAMAKSKGGQPVRRVIIQEGVYTFETWGDQKAVAEPVVYLWGERVVGGFYRVHKDRGKDENLNAPGMHFEPLAFAKPCQMPKAQKVDECENRFYVYGVIARLSMLAAAQEMLGQRS